MPLEIQITEDYRNTIKKPSCLAEVYQIWNAFGISTDSQKADLQVLQAG